MYNFSQNKHIDQYQCFKKLHLFYSPIKRKKQKNIFGWLALLYGQKTQSYFFSKWEMISVVNWLNDLPVMFGKYKGYYNSAGCVKWWPVWVLHTQGTSMFIPPLNQMFYKRMMLHSQVRERDWNVLSQCQLISTGSWERLRDNVALSKIIKSWTRFTPPPPSYLQFFKHKIV